MGRQILRGAAVNCISIRRSAMSMKWRICCIRPARRARKRSGGPCWRWQMLFTEPPAERSENNEPEKAALRGVRISEHPQFRCIQVQLRYGGGMHTGRRSSGEMHAFPGRQCGQSTDEYRDGPKEETEKTQENAARRVTGRRRCFRLKAVPAGKRPGRL